jgi:serine/threonine-protein kinase RsbW
MKRSSKKKAGTLAYELTCKSDPRELGKVETFLMKINKKAHLDDGTMYRLLVATTEAVNNAILHGNKRDPKKVVKIACYLETSSLKIKVTDRGKGFDPAHLANPLDEANLLKESGRGVFLIRSLMDDVSFEMRKSGTTVVIKLDLTKLGSG